MGLDYSKVKLYHVFLKKLMYENAIDEDELELLKISRNQYEMFLESIRDESFEKELKRFDRLQKINDIRDETDLQ